MYVSVSSSAFGMERCNSVNTSQPSMQLQNRRENEMAADVNYIGISRY
jgi:hypothetical protein